MTLAPYPEYRSSPLTPTGVAPKHWLDGAVKRGFRITLGKMVIASNENDDRTTQPYLRSANVQDGWLALDDVKEMYFSPTEAASLSLLEGDLVICEGGDVGRCALLRENLEGYGFQNSINRARGIGDNCTTYLAYWLSHLKNNGFIDVLCNRSTIAHYTAEKLANTPMLMPTPEEQSAIAAFLDQETGKIDALVAEQERLIALLKEKRQAVISQAVTKGLNPNAPMKDSGIEWLGQVPAHWDVVPIKAVCTLFGRIGYRGYTTADIVDEGAGAVTLSPSNMADGFITLDKCTFISWHKYEESPEIMVRTGDIVMVKTGSTLGKLAYVDFIDQPTTINPQLVLFKNISCGALFLFYVMNSKMLQCAVEINNTGSSIPTITQEAIGNFRFGMPPSGEQVRIIEFIDTKLRQLDTLITEATKAITLLRERRAALISAAVTGKIDVRSLAPTKQEAA